MKTNILKAICLATSMTAATAMAQKMDIVHIGDTTVIRIDKPTKYLLLPIQEEKKKPRFFSAPVHLPTHGWT